MLWKQYSSSSHIPEHVINVIQSNYIIPSLSKGRKERRDRERRTKLFRKYKKKINLQHFKSSIHKFMLV